MNDIRNPVLHTAGLAAAEAAANAALRLSPHSVQALQQLAGQVLALECTRPALTVYAHSDESGELKLRGVHEGPVATRVTGTLEDFSELARSDDPAATLINGNIRLEGSSATLIDMQRILGALDIDWEAPLVAGLGDVVGHQLATMLGAAFEWSRTAGASIQRQLREFAQEEARLTPPRIALEHFYDDVQSLSDRTERLTQRIARLRERLQDLGRKLMSRVGRLLQIMRVVGRYRLDDLLPEQARHPVLSILLRANPWRLGGVLAPRGERLRRALEELGPVFVKFGQMLSTRRDLLPADLADELARLQDQVPPFPSHEAVALIEASLGGPVDTLFDRFDREPMASASVAQVHGARTREGREVVAKVIRPGIEQVIEKDMALLALLARLLERWFRDGRRLRPVEVVADYRRTILDELDLGREAANASQLRRNFADGSLVYVPEVFWELTRRNVMVMERIRGIPVTDLATLREKNVDLKLLGERGVEIFFTQVFRDSFFHADMHPGNIFIDASDPADPRYIAIDCAIIGSLTEEDQYYLARNLLAIFRRDYHAVAQLHVECGWVPPDTRIPDFESAMRAVCEPVFERPIAEISFGQLLIYLFRTAARFDMQVQPSLVLLQKTLLNIEGLGRQLYPQLNLWDTAMPFLERWISERYSPQSFVRRLQHHAPNWLEQLPQLPEVVLDNLQGHRERQRRIEQALTAERRSREQQDKRARRRYVAAMLCLLAAGAALPPIREMLEQAPTVSWVLLALAAGLAWPGQST